MFHIKAEKYADIKEDLRLEVCNKIIQNNFMIDFNG